MCINCTPITDSKNPKLLFFMLLDLLQVLFLVSFWNFSQCYLIRKYLQVLVLDPWQTCGDVKRWQFHLLWSTPSAAWPSCPPTSTGCWLDGCLGALPRPCCSPPLSPGMCTSTQRDMGSLLNGLELLFLWQLSGMESLLLWQVGINSRYWLEHNICIFKRKEKIYIFTREWSTWYCKMISWYR